MKKNFFYSILGLGMAFLPLLAFLPLISMTPEPVLAQSTCTGIGLSGNDSAPLICGGNCSKSGWKCKNKRGGSRQSGYYYYCTCKNGSHVSEEQACCHLIAKKNSDGVYYLDVHGVCTVSEGCAQTDGLTCKLSGNQPVCSPPNQNPF